MKREFIKALFPDVSDETLEKIMEEHGKSVEAAKTQIAGLNQAVSELKTKESAAIAKIGELETKLKAYDGVDITALQGELDTLKEDKEKLVADHTAALRAAQQDALLRERIAGELFSSDYAKRGVYDEIKEIIKFEDGNLIGYDEAIASIREKQPNAFYTAPEPPAVSPKDGGKPHKGGGGTDPFLEGFNRQ